MILPRTPDESLVVDVARGLDVGSMIEQAHKVAVPPAGNSRLSRLSTEYNKADRTTRERDVWCLLFVSI